MKKVKMLYDTDPYLMPYKGAIDARHARILEAVKRYGAGGNLRNGINNHLFYGLHRTPSGDWVFREWAPNATKHQLLGAFHNWKRPSA